MSIENTIRLATYTILGMFILFLITNLQGCGTSARINVVADWRGEIQGDNPCIILQVEKQITDNWKCGYTHLSFLATGQPWNDRDEDTLDGLHCSRRLW